MLAFLVLIVAIIVLIGFMKALDEISKKLGGGFVARISEAIMPIFIAILAVIGLAILCLVSY